MIKLKSLIFENFVSGPVYHGTNVQFNIFDFSKIGSRTDPGFFGRGFYFVDDLENAKRWGPYVMTKRVRFKNPLIVNGITEFYNKTGMKQVGGDKKLFKQEVDRVTNELIKKGYDGVIHNRSDGITQYVVFTPEGIIDL